MACNEAFFYLGWTLMDRGHVEDLTALICATRTGSPSPGTLSLQKDCSQALKAKGPTKD
jgi:hypothetical protein